MNPLVAPYIRRYPVIPKDGVISEVWHARKWRHDLDRHILSPMYDAGHGIHYFIDEPAMLLNMKVVIPVRWLEDEKGGIWAEAWEVECDGSTVSVLCEASIRTFQYMLTAAFTHRSFQRLEMIVLS